MAFVEMQPYIWIPSAPKIYGAEWAGTSDPAWTRTDDAVGLSDPNPAVNNGNGNSPFDNIMPWAGMKRVEDSVVGTLVEIPKFYYKWTRDGIKMKLQISASPVDGFLVSPAHTNRGDGKGERDVVYIGAYHCASDYKSKTGVLPLTNKTRAEFRTGIHNLGSTIWQNDFAMFWTIRMLYLVEYAHWNSQLKIGYGCSNSGTGSDSSGLCDSMTYHTGTNAIDRTTYGHTRYRYIEDLWGNSFDWCDGIYFAELSVYCIKNPANFSDTSNGTLVGSRITLSGANNNNIKSWNNPTEAGYEYALCPNSTITYDGEVHTVSYIGDAYYYNESGQTLIVGSYYAREIGHGMFTFGTHNTASQTRGSTGSRLMKLP